ncbi:helix-turn-helix transcriptional regulator [Propionivibrio dicarboxylicus]|uniref:Regulatory protein, luxR family n=1 Tax=Propionivibrio dicarboxylicus TaxID=83767 RepID=A0A1G8AM21_9RHOO|nr:helix-turn-helix transcriptional regulator [Propionivibrio dicarboxylicus]SDH21984.1 regulatory protein, luxR family [Propionivibrio dicarboxylicus]
MEQFSKVVLDIYGSAHECSLTEFDSQALGLMKRLVGFDSAAVLGIVYAPENGIKVQSIHLHNQPIEKLTERQHLKSEDGLGVMALRHKGRSIIADSQVDNRHKPDMLAYCRKFNVAHGLTLIDEGISKFNLDTISLWRARPKDAYDATDKKLSELIIPHLFKARAINQRIHLKHDEPQLQRISLLSGFDGSLQFADAPTIAVLAAEWGNWIPPILPALFMEALRRSSSRQYLGRTFNATCTVHDRFLFIQLTLHPRRNGLTQAETRVASLAAKGLSYKEIAREIGISPATVRNQLHSIYLKLGIANKAALAQSFSAEIRLLQAPVA